MSLAVLVVCTAFLLGGLVASLQRNYKWAASCLFMAAIIAAAYLMDVALRGG